MNYEKWRELFPESKIVPTNELQTDALSFPLENGKHLQIAKERLSERELLLLQQLTGINYVPKKVLNPWQRYLEGNGSIPTEVNTLLFIHIAFAQQPSDFHETEWLKMMHALFPQSLTIFRCFSKHYTIVLSHSHTPSQGEDLRQLHHTLEEDFGITMHFFVGNLWSQRKEIPKLYQAEKALFVSYLHESSKQSYLEFTATVLWGLTNPRVDLTPIPVVLQELIENDTAHSLIETLWEERGIITKTAHRLFIHRNTLQYRIDRFAERSGIYLKNINDLTLAHLLLNLREY